MYFITLIEAAGWPIWTIILASVVALAVILERLYTLRKSYILPNGTLAQALQSYPQQDEHEKSFATLQQSPLGQVLTIALQYADQPFEQAKEAIENTGHHIAHQLNRYLNTLGTIAAIAPLLGLLGTVIGMIEIFGSQTPNGSNPAVLAHGISVALYNTAFGIIVAVPSLMFYRYFRSQVEGFLLEMEYQAFQLIDTLHKAPSKQREEG
jgi:biopolymer transport protein ExbB